MHPFRKLLTIGIVSITSSICLHGQSNVKSVTIGTQTWMATNLDVSTFRNGDPIGEVKTDEEWYKASKEKRPAWCYYKNSAEEGKKYGKMYNWFAVSDPRGLAPSGWHIPSDNEWQILIKFLGGYAGRDMKATTGWVDASATNTSGFGAMPGGFRHEHGPFVSSGSRGLWWSATGSQPFSAWAIALVYNSVLVDRNIYLRGRGYSVRCVKD